MLGVTSAYYLGFQAPHYFLRTQLQKYILISRSFVTLVMALLPIIQALSLYSIDHTSVTSRGEEEILSGAVQTIAWSLHLMYTYLIYHRLSPSIRGPRPMLMSWSVCLLVNIMQVDMVGK